MNYTFGAPWCLYEARYGTPHYRVAWAESDTSWQPESLRFALALPPPDAPPPSAAFPAFSELPVELQDLIFDATASSQAPVRQLLFALTCRRFWRLFGGLALPGAALTLELCREPNALALVQWACSWGAVLHSESLVVAAARNDERLVDFLIVEQKIPLQVLRCALEVACYTGNKAILQRLRLANAPLRAEATVAAAFGGHVDVLSWLTDVWCPISASLTEVAAYGGHVEVLEWAHARGQQLDELLYSTAVRAGHIHVLRWLEQAGLLMPHPPYIVPNAIKSGDLAMVRYVWRDHMHSSLNAPTILYFVGQSDSLDMLRFFYERGCCPDMETAIAFARKGNLDALKWLRYTALSKDAWTQEALREMADIAADSGRVDLLEWLRTEFELNYSESPSLLERAARFAMMDTVAYFRSLRAPWSCNVARLVAAAGTLSDMRRLRALGCPLDTSFMAACAFHGKLAALEWAHHLGTPIDAEACVAAAASGKLGALQWLREHGCPWDTRVFEVSKHRHCHVYAYALQHGCADEMRAEPAELNANIFSELQLDFSADEDEDA